MQHPPLSQCFTFSLPKINEQDQDIQDACCVSPDQSLIAIADGASTSYLPKAWADILVKHFCNSSDNDRNISTIHQHWKQWLEPCQQQWGYYQNKKANSSPQWYQKPSPNKYFASATFIGLKLQPIRQNENIWEAVAIGDSCLFHLRKNISNTPEIIHHFPIDNSDEFETTTECFHSMKISENQLFEPKYTSGHYQVGDIFLLATDALAKYILKNIEDQRDQWQHFFAVKTQQDFKQLIEELRADQQIENDDTTLIICKVNQIISPQLPSRRFNENQISTDAITPHVNPSIIQENYHPVHPENLPQPPKRTPEGKRKPKKKGYKKSSKSLIIIIIILVAGILSLGILSNPTNILSKLSSSFQDLSSPKKEPENPNTNLGTNENIAVYDQQEKKQISGYLLEKVGEKKTLDVWVLVPPTSENNSEVKIPEAIIIPLFVAHQADQNINLDQEFVGYLKSGTYSIQETKKLNQNTNWGKIRVYLK